MKYKPFNLEAVKAGAPFISRDGRPARFIAHVPEADNGWRLICLVQGSDRPQSFYDGGLYSKFDQKPQDILMAPVKRKGWVNIYHEDGDARNMISNTREEADARSGPSRVACIEVEYVEGQGL